jgi:DNA uptake protein ComE-like DNA-binding protein
MEKLLIGKHAYLKEIYLRNDKDARKKFDEELYSKPPSQDGPGALYIAAGTKKSEQAQGDRWVKIGMASAGKDPYKRLLEQKLYPVGTVNTKLHKKTERLTHLMLASVHHPYEYKPRPTEKEWFYLRDGIDPVMCATAVKNLVEEVQMKLSTKVESDSDSETSDSESEDDSDNDSDSIAPSKKAPAKKPNKKAPALPMKKVLGVVFVKGVAKVNINSASLSDFLTAEIPQLARKRAEMIIAHRNKNGYFKNIDGIKSIWGFRRGGFYEDFWKERLFV